MNLAVVLAIWLPVAFDHPSTTILGTIHSVDQEAHVFVIRSKKGKFTVHLQKSSKFLLLRRVFLRDARTEEKAYVLGQKKVVNWGSGTTDEIVHVSVIVIGQHYSPPPVPAPLKKRNISWHSGTLTHEVAQNKYFLEQMVWVHASPGNPVFEVDKGQANPWENLKKGQTTCLRGLVDRKAKSVTLEEATVFTTSVPSKEIPLLVDLQGKSEPAATQPKKSE